MQQSSSSSTVLIIGCGVAGPVLAILLKRKGYNPIVFEKVKELGDAGASLMLMPNGLKVLDLIGLADPLINSTIPLAEFRDQTSTGEALGGSPLLSMLRERYGYPAAGVKRTELNLALKRRLLCEEEGIELREGWRLVGVEERGGNDEVVASFDGGRTASGSILVGCDGLKAASRGLVLGKGGVEVGGGEFTGLTQTSGFSPTPPSLSSSPPALLNTYGPSAHFITYRISPTHSSWALTLPSTTPSPESWHLYNSDELAAAKTELGEKFSSWCSPVPELIATTERMLKFGLFDRPELQAEQWFAGRCVLLGDAAHPTSPHLGQGANQALEDVWHLSALLPDLASSSSFPECLSTPALTQIFTAFAAKRQPRTAALVKGARAQGERRVVTGGAEACRKRDEEVRSGWMADDEKSMLEKADGVFGEPFLVG